MTKRANQIFGVDFSTANEEQVVSTFLSTPEQGQDARFVVTANVDHIVQLRRNADLRDAYAHAWYRTVDGTPVYLYARLRGVDLHKVTGADLFAKVMERLNPAVHRPFFVCASEDIAQGLRQGLVKRGFSPDMVGSIIPPFGFEKDAAFGERMATAIRDHGTTHLFFGVGCPKSEIWMNRYRKDLGDVYACAVGAALAFHIGALSRAPRLVRKIGMEWLWRALQEPNRLLKRYFVHSWAFLAIVRDDMKGSVRLVDNG